MITVAICDDDTFICSQIENILDTYAQETHLKMDISVFYTGESLIDYLNQNNTFDLIYLDIELGKMNGVAVGKEIRQVLKDYRTEIVYISGNDTYDRQLFDVQPLHFIPKPIQKALVINDLKLALNRMPLSEKHFKYQKGHDIYSVPVSEILYFESRKREIIIITTSTKDSFYSTLDDVSESLSDAQFIQIHRSYLINYNHAKVLRYSEVVMSNDDVLPIGKTKRRSFRNRQLNDL